jgi:hypothetical protein
MDSNTLNALLEKILTLLERFTLLITTWYGATQAEKAKSSIKAANAVLEDIEDKNKVKALVEGMKRDEKIKIAVNDD